jgi:kumamolisin
MSGILTAACTAKTNPLTDNREKSMIRKFSTGILAIVALVSAATVVCRAEQPTLTRHTRDVVANGQAAAVGHLPAAQSMRLVLALPLRDEAGLEEFLRDVNDSTSPNYHHFLTVEQFTERFGPTQDDYDTVVRFAKNNGLTVVKTSRNRVNLDVTGSVASIEKALHVSLGLYQHPTENRTFYAPDREPTLDLPLQLWHVSGLDNYSTPRRNLIKREASAPGAISNATTGSCPQASFCGSDMRAAYYGGTTLTGAGQSVGLFELLGTDLVDLTTYYTNAHQTNNVPITLTSVDGQSTLCKESSCDDTEQTLDMTQALGMAPGLSSLVMYIGKGGLAGQSVDDAAIFNAMATASPLNAQLSSSWAWRPADPNTDNPYFLEFAAQGQNLFEASGDSGNWGTAEFVWPADSVYVTAVGGTDLDTASAGGAWKSETAWIDGGGGISPDKYTIPSWQVALAAGCSSCSQKYRNGPDVSANANFSFYVCADQTTCTANLYGGTSFAAPMWAGYLALANQQAVSNGSPTLGFINPTLYTIGAGTSYDTDFHDITSGTNGTYSATVGYDLATGLGSPNGANLINALAPAVSADFTIAAAPKQVKVTQGTTGKSKVTTTISGSFDSSIALSATGQETGVTVLFQPSTIAAPGAGTATVGFKVSATAKTGIETITITGTGGGKTHTATVMIDVVKAAN